MDPTRKFGVKAIQTAQLRDAREAWPPPDTLPPPRTREDLSDQVEPVSEAVLPQTEAFLRREAAFWATDPLLESLSQFCHDRMVSRYAVLGVVVTRMLAATTYDLRLPAIIGSEASLNFFLAIVGPSGRGKSAAISAARDFIDFSHYKGPDGRVAPTANLRGWLGDAPVLGLGSGEGMVQAFLMKDPDNPAGKPVRNPDVPSLIFLAPEVDTLSALKDRKGATLLPTLRQAWDSSALGMTNAAAELNRHIDAHTYRLCLIVGVQPKRSAGLMDDGGAGTPQRMYWVPAEDPSIPEPTDDDPPAWETRLWDPRHLDPSKGVEVCALARKTIRTAHWQRSNPLAQAEGEPLDGHALLCRLKLATGLSLLLRGTAVVDEWAWELSAFLMEVSDRAREQCLKGISAALIEEGERDGVIAGAKQVRQAEVATERLAARCAESILRWMTKGRADEDANLYPLTTQQALQRKATPSLKAETAWKEGLVAGRDMLVAQGGLVAGYVLSRAKGSEKETARQAWVFPGDEHLLLAPDVVEQYLEVERRDLQEREIRERGAQAWN